MFRFQLENPDWPDPPLLQYYLLENFYPVAGLLLGITVLALVLSIAIRRPWTKRVALISVILMISLTAISILVQTPRERMRSATAALVDASTPTVEASAVEHFFAENVEVALPNGLVLLRGRSAVMADIQQRVEGRYRFEQVWISALDARQLGDTHGQSEMIVVGRVEGGGFGVGFKTRMRFDFEKIENDWLITRVTIVQVYDNEPAGRFW